MKTDTASVLLDKCPVCGRLNDRVAAADGGSAVPTEGDLSVCFGCGAFLTFNADLSSRELTLEEVGRLRDSERIQLQRVRRAVVEVGRIEGEGQ